MTLKNGFVQSATDQTFKNYFVCPENQIAHAAARHVARYPGTNFNPFCIYGCSGTGKTHILNAIIDDIKNYHPELNSAYIPINNFTDEQYAIYYDSDILLIDEYGSMCKTPATQRRIVSFIETLLLENKQVVLVAAKMPVNWKWSFITDLSLPGYISRLDYLQKLVERSNIPYTEESLNYMANTLITGIGIINSFFKITEMISELTGMPISIKMIRTLLKELKIKSN